MQSHDGMANAGLGLLAAIGAGLAQYGTSWTALALVVLGAGLAVLDLDSRDVREIIALLSFNIVVGLFGGAIATTWIMSKGWVPVEHHMLLVIFSFAGGYVGKDAGRTLMPMALSFAKKFLGIGGSTK